MRNFVEQVTKRGVTTPGEPLVHSQPTASVPGINYRSTATVTRIKGLLEANERVNERSWVFFFFFTGIVSSWN